MQRPEPRIRTSELDRLIAHARSGRDLSADEAERAFSALMVGSAPAEDVAALLLALRTKGESPAEVAGGVRALQRAMIRVPAREPGRLVDTCGTGGGSLTTFNISTAAALVAAGAGARIAKHGNRSFTSRCGSADVLEELGVSLQLTPPAIGRVLERAGIVFMFAPLLHPAMRHVAPVRRELGVFTIMNLLGPLTNPAGARRQVVGVPEPGLVDLVAGALVELGHEHALVVHGEPGMDELSPLGRTIGVEVRAGRLLPLEIRPERFGWRGLSAAELKGGEPAENARIIEEVLDGGRGGAARAAVLLNAGAALYVAGVSGSLEEGVERAAAALEEGAGRRALDSLRRISAEEGLSAS